LYLSGQTTFHGASQKLFIWIFNMNIPEDIPILPSGRLPEICKAVDLDDGDLTSFGLDLGGKNPYELLDEIKKTTEKNVTVVKLWQWWDLKVWDENYSDADIAEIEKETRAKGVDWPPSMVMADLVMASTNPCFEEGHWVKTSPLVEFRDNYLFETQNTIYVLTGPGLRKKVSPKIAMSFF